MENQSEKNSFKPLPWVVVPLLIVFAFLMYRWIGAEKGRGDGANHTTELKKSEKNEQLDEDARRELSEEERARKERLKKARASLPSVSFVSLSEEELDNLDESLAAFYRRQLNQPEYYDRKAVRETFQLAREVMNKRVQEENEEWNGLVEELDRLTQLLEGESEEPARVMNQMGRATLKMGFYLIEERDGRLMGQLRTLKEELGEIQLNAKLASQSEQIGDYFDQLFVMLYLIEEEDQA